MLVKTANLTGLKQAVSAIPTGYQSMAATIGLLASSGLNHTHKMPEMCHLLHNLFGLESCGYFWSDEGGSMQDAWCLSPDFLNYKTLMSCLEYQASGVRTWPPFRENVLQGPIAGYLLPFQNDHFYASAHFASVYQTQNIRHVLDVTLHDGIRPFGAFLLMRSAQQGPFRPDERNVLEKLIPLLNMAFNTPSCEHAIYADNATIGFGLVNPDGTYKSMNCEARRIVWMLAHSEPGSFANPNAPSIESHLEQWVAAHFGKAFAEKEFSIDINNRWGRFTLTFEQEPRTHDTIVTLHRKIPLASRLAFCLARHRWPPMRQIVAWLLAQGLPRNEIAVALNLSVETVTSHIKLIYKATDTSSSHGLMLALSK